MGLSIAKIRTVRVQSTPYSVQLLVSENSLIYGRTASCEGCGQRRTANATTTEYFHCLITTIPLYYFSFHHVFFTYIVLCGLCATKYDQSCLDPVFATPFPSIVTHPAGRPSCALCLCYFTALFDHRLCQTLTAIA